MTDYELYELKDNLSSLKSDIQMDIRELSDALTEMREIISMKDTRAKDLKYKGETEELKIMCGGIEDDIHYIEKTLASMRRRLHGRNGADVKMKNLIEHIRAGFMDFDEYEE